MHSCMPGERVSAIPSPGLRPHLPTTGGDTVPSARITGKIKIMRSNLRTVLAAAAVLVGVSATGAFAGEPVAYPRTVGNGENIDVQYGPGPQGNVVGGGVVQSRQSGEETTDVYVSRGPRQADDGLVPVARGHGENISVVYLPAPDARG